MESLATETFTVSLIAESKFVRHHWGSVLVLPKLGVRSFDPTGPSGEMGLLDQPYPIADPSCDVQWFASLSSHLFSALHFCCTCSHLSHGDQDVLEP